MEGSDSDMRRAWTGAAILVICINVFVIYLAAAEASQPGAAGRRLDRLVSAVELPLRSGPVHDTAAAAPSRPARASQGAQTQLAAFPLLSLPEPFAQLAMLAMLGAIAWGLRTL
jgi:hypothetical protein